jgi:hypothetical protein
MRQRLQKALPPLHSAFCFGRAQSHKSIIRQKLGLIKKIPSLGFSRVLTYNTIWLLQLRIK